MGENKLRIETKAKSGTGVTATVPVCFWSREEVELESYFEEGFPVQHVPKIAFVMALGLFYIGNTHYAEKTVRKINNMQAEVEDLRADYTTMKSDLMFASKQSEVARKVSAFGLEESSEPPIKIVVEKGEY